MRAYTILAVILTLCVMLGCARTPPRYFSVDPDFTESEQAVIRDVVDAWCDAVGYCPEEAAWADEGRIRRVHHLSQDDIASCPDGLVCKVAARNKGDDILVAADRPLPDDMDLLWVGVAHEVGHYCTGHLDGGLMAARHGVGEPLAIDQTAIEGWKDGCD